MHLSRLPFLSNAATALVFVGAGVSVHAQLGRFGADTWREEVLLHDGQTIIIERSESYGGRSEPGQSGPIKEHAIRFTLPGANKTIAWTSEYDETLGRTNFNLLALHVLNGTPYVVAEPNLCLAYSKWGRPNPPYVYFRYDGNAWHRISLEQFPAELNTINVAHNTVGRDAQEMVRLGFVPVEKIKEMNISSAPQYRSILREPLAKQPCPQYPSGPKAPLPIAPSSR